MPLMRVLGSDEETKLFLISVMLSATTDPHFAFPCPDISGNAYYVFQDSLAALMQTLGAAHPYFVRCLKPNLEKAASSFNTTIVLNQLRYSGMMETVRIRRAGYPVRREFADFMFR